MKLDFTAFDNLGDKEAPSGAKTETHDIGKIDRAKREWDLIRGIYNNYQSNIKTSETIRKEILIGLEEGENPIRLLLKAMECISLLTGDSVLYSQGKDDVIAIYGRGLEDNDTLKTELEETEKRLELLLRPDLMGEDTPADDKKRIERAILAHKKRIDRIKADISKYEADDITLYEK